MKRILSILLLLAAFTLVLGACSSEEQPNSSQPSVSADSANYPIEVYGVNIVEKPTRVVSLSPALTEVVYELGYGDCLVGRSNNCDAPSQAQSLEAMGTMLEPDTQKIIDSKAQYVLTQSDIPYDERMKLEQADIRVLTVSPVAHMEDWENFYTTLGSALGGKEDGAAAGQAAYQTLMEKLDGVKAKVNALNGGEPLEICYIVMLPDVMATGDTLIGEVLEYVGFSNAAKEYGEWKFASDKLLELDPDVILFSDEMTLEELEANQYYTTVKAVTNGHAYKINAASFERMTLQMAEYLDIVADDLAKE